jgi:hypothetical protein
MPPSRLYIVAIDGFDNPNQRLVTPKKYVNPPINRGHYPNLGPKHPTHVDKRLPPLPGSATSRGGSSDYDRYNGGDEKVQILLLTSVAINPVVMGVPPVPVAGALPHAAWKQDGPTQMVSDKMARGRAKGFEDRTKIVEARRALRDSMRVIWTQQIPRAGRIATVADPNADTYADGSAIRRVRVNIRDEYAGVPGGAGRYSGNARYVWVPSGIDTATCAGVGDPQSMTAIGCTCRDAVFRGASFARYGCKHIIAYNAFRASNKIVFP